ncbi:MAG: hypothetical protein Q9191_005761 [Dirinaria sp. TL-2023a]
MSSQSNMGSSTALPDHRGRNKRAASPTSLTSSPPKHARIEDNGSANHIPAGDSALEKLPTELLEMVFILPRSSPILGKRLASNHIKTKLFLLVFTSETYEPGETDPDLRNLGYLLSILGTYESIGRLQSDILALKWATPSFVRELTEPFLVRTISREFRRSGLADRKTAHLEISFDLMETGRLVVDKEGKLDAVSRGYKRKITGGRIIEEGPLSELEQWEWKNESHNVRVNVHVAFREGWIELTATNFEDDDIWGDELLHCASKLMLCLDHCRIPIKFLHGPWSDEKCETLQRISRGGGRIDLPGRRMEKEVAETGLCEAIREGNKQAIVAFVGSVHTLIFKNVVDEWCYECERFADELPSWEGWNTIGMCERHVHRYCVGLTVGTKHLQLALASDCSHAVLHALLHGLKVDIDWADPEILEWALQKEYPDDRGEWLLDRIETSNEQRFELEEIEGVSR